MKFYFTLIEIEASPAYSDLVTNFLHNTIYNIYNKCIEKM